MWLSRLEKRTEKQMATTERSSRRNSLWRVKPIDLSMKQSEDQEHGLKRTLDPISITLLGIGAIVGTGIFVLTGVAAAKYAGPGLIFSFVVAGIVSGLAAICYAEFASTVPIARSAFGITLPQALTASPFSGGIINLPGFLIILLITALLVLGTSESARVNNVMVAIKLAVIVFFLVVGFGHIQTANWNPFLPFGAEGIFRGAAIIFFAYIGFDQISTSAEETRNPAKDLPIGIFLSLLICTALYFSVY